jgi:glycerol-3-phosphate acyltransferase PlsY
VASGSPTTQAVVEGLKATLGGKNPVWAAIKGAWSRASLKLKLAVVLILLVTLLLAPVLLLVLVLGLLVAALIVGIRAATR